MSEQWKSDIKDWDAISEEKTDFIFSEGNRYLKYAIEANEYLDKKACVNLWINFILMLICCYIFFSKFNFLNLFDHHNLLLVPIGFIIILYGFIFFTLNQCLNPRTENVYIGNEPKNLLTQLTCDQELRMLKLGLLFNVQDTINNAIVTNQYKASKLKLSFKLSLYAPIILIILELIRPYVSNTP